MNFDQNNIGRYECCLTRKDGPHRFNCPVYGLMAVQTRIEKTRDCCPRLGDGEHDASCTSNEAVLGRVNLEEARLDKMAQVVEHRMKHGNPLDRLKQMVEAGEMTAEKEQANGGTFIRFTSTKNPELKTRYGPLTEPMVQEAKWADATVTQALTPPQNQVTVTTKPGKYYPSKRVNWLRRRVGWVLIQLGYRVAGV